jgi:ABC-type lipoprotein export system ATPase subunit
VSVAPLLRIEALEARYGGAIRALSGVDLTVAPGEIVALVGSNGAGKTTVLKAVSNLLPAERGQVTAGRVLYDGRDVSRTPTDALVRAGLVGVLEGRHCFRALSVEENLVTGGLGRGSNRAAIRDDLARIYAIFPRLARQRRALAGLTSGGEQQMVAIGRALMGRPRRGPDDPGGRTERHRRPAPCRPGDRAGERTQRPVRRRRGPARPRRREGVLSRSRVYARRHHGLSGRVPAPARRRKPHSESGHK